MATNNVAIFNAAFSAALTSLSGWDTSTTAAHYDPVITAAVNFATEVDSQIPTDGSMTATKASLCEAICRGVLRDRSVPSVSAATWLGISAAIGAYYARAAAQLL